MSGLNLVVHPTLIEPPDNADGFRRRADKGGVRANAPFMGAPDNRPRDLSAQTLKVAAVT